MVSMTSPIGVVPQELELTYPAQHYDSVVTGDWSEDEKSFVAEVLRRYLERNDYPRIIAHLPPGAYTRHRRARRRFAGPRDSRSPTTQRRRIRWGTSPPNGGLRPLSETRARTQHYPRRCDYQFGEGAGDELFDDLSTQGRYPQLRADDADGEQLAALARSTACSR